MSNQPGVESFRLARMSTMILVLTLLLLALPLVFVVGSLTQPALLTLPALVVITLYAWVWLRLRPQRFDVSHNGLEVVWPLKRRVIPLADISGVRLMDGRQVKDEIGWGLRIGAGGLWGGFGWLWTRKRGIIQMYISRTDGFVWIDRVGSRPWLITPARPEAFVHALSRYRT